MERYRNWGFTAENLSNKIYIYHSKSDEIVPFEIAYKSATLLKNSTFFEYKDEEHSSQLLLEDAIINIGQGAKIEHGCARELKKLNDQYIFDSFSQRNGLI